MRRAVYEVGPDLEQHARCLCRKRAFGVAVEGDGTWFLRTSTRWAWDGDRFRYGKRPSRGLPSRERRGPAQLAMRASDLPRAYYGNRSVTTDFWVPLPEQFACDKCGESSLVELP